MGVAGDMSTGVELVQRSVVRELGVDFGFWRQVGWDNGAKKEEWAAERLVSFRSWEVGGNRLGKPISGANRVNCF